MMTNTGILKANSPTLNAHRRSPLIKWITVHCSATSADQNIGANDIRQWHQQRGWHDIGYHFVIRRNGSIEVGRPIDVIGAHVKGHNQGNIGLCLVGGSDKTHKPQDNFTLAQRKALFKLITELQARFLIPDSHVTAHNEWNCDKACPVITLKEPK